MLPEQQKQGNFQTIDELIIPKIMKVGNLFLKSHPRLIKLAQDL